MLRGYSRHDGISNKQSAKERDRDRQRERQRQQRAQMLPNDDKDITTSAHDLFHAPVKGDPTVDDPTTLEIRKTLGPFESVRKHIVEGPPGRSLIGVDQPNPLAHARNPGGPRPVQPPITKTPPIPRIFPPPNANSSNNLQNNIKSINSIQKVPLSQNQLPHHLSQGGNNPKLQNCVGSNPHEQNSSQKSVPNLNAHTNNNSVSVEPPSVPTVNNKDKNVNINSGILSSDTTGAEYTNEKQDRALSSRKPALERADSQLELESILKEMMDVTTPITAIQTPAKESPSKKYTPRRASKSEDAVKLSEVNMNVPPPITDMDSSDSSSSESDGSSGSDTEDSSSGSQGGVENPETNVSKPTATTNSPARWDLSSFIQKNNSRGTPDSSATISPKDGKSKENASSSTMDSGTSPGDAASKADVSSTSFIGKSVSSSPAENVTSGKFTKSSNLPYSNLLDQVEGQFSKVPSKSPRKTPDVKPDGGFSKPVPPTIPMKGQPAAASGASKLASLSASSSEDEENKPKEPLRPPPEKTKAQGAGNKRKRRAKTPEAHGHKSDEDDSSPEAEKTKTQAIQDKNKKNTLAKLFRPAKKKGSPSVESEGGKAGPPSAGGKGKGSKPSASNRVSAKDKGKKNKGNPAVVVHNGDLDPKANKASSSGNPTGKKKENATKDSTFAAPHSSTHHNNKKRSHKSHSNPATSTTATTTQKSTNEGPSSNAHPPVISTNPSNAVRVKEEPGGKSTPTSLVCRIPLSNLLRKPPIPPATAPTTTTTTTTTTTASATVNAIKIEKEADKAVGNTATDSAQQVRLHYGSSRVGSSSDNANSAHQSDGGADRQRDETMCSDSEEPPSKMRKRAKKKPRSPKKITKKSEPDSHSKVEEDTTVVEVSSNVFGYSCDSVSVSTTRTPPVEVDVAPAPDSSLNPLQLASPVVPPQPIYYSFFEKNDTQLQEDYYTRDQDTYLEEAKRLKHKADNEKISTTQASTYLEAGLYFILTGLSMERDRAVGSQSAYTMYKDTLSLIRYIGNRFRGSRADYADPTEAKIIVLSMRCQSLLSLKLFKIKTRESKDVAQYLSDHFAKVPALDQLPVSSSPQLSTPSPHSPTLSPAGSSGILQVHTPSPHPHQNHLHTTIPRSVYNHLYKHYHTTHNLMQAHELWEQADSLVERYHMEEFFISIDRQYGPLTLHNSLVDLVRYVKHCLKVLNVCSDIS